MARKIANRPIGSRFEDDLREAGPLASSSAPTMRRELAEQLPQIMKQRKVAQMELARRMKTSRAAVHWLLDANDTSVTLMTFCTAASALGCSVTLHGASPATRGTTPARKNRRGAPALGSTLEDAIAALPPAQRRSVQARTKQLIAEELALARDAQRKALAVALQVGLESGVAGPLDIEDVIRRGRARLARAKTQKAR